MEVEGELSFTETTPRLLKLISARNLCLVLVIRERVSVLRRSGAGCQAITEKTQQG